MTMVKNLNGTEIDYEAAEQHMDEYLCNALNDTIAPCTEQEFFTAYEAAHQKKYGEEFFLSAANPTY